MTGPPTDARLTTCLTPHGRLVAQQQDDAPALEAALAERIRNAFARGSGHGLLHLGAVEVGQILPPAFSYWRELGARFVTALCTRPDTGARRIEVRRHADRSHARAAAAVRDGEGLVQVQVADVSEAADDDPAHRHHDSR